MPPTSPVRVLDDFPPVKKPFFLQYRAQRFYSRLHTTVAELIAGAVRGGLDSLSSRR